MDIPFEPPEFIYEEFVFSATQTGLEFTQPSAEEVGYGDDPARAKLFEAVQLLEKTRVVLAGEEEQVDAKYWVVAKARENGGCHFSFFVNYSDDKGWFNWEGELRLIPNQDDCAHLEVGRKKGEKSFQIEIARDKAYDRELRKTHDLYGRIRKRPEFASEVTIGNHWADHSFDDWILGIEQQVVNLYSFLICFMNYLKYGDKHAVEVLPAKKKKPHPTLVRDRPWLGSSGPRVLLLDRMPTTQSQGTGTHASPKPHRRRGHWKTLSHPRFRHHPQYGKKIYVKPSFVGPRQVSYEGNIYRLIEPLDDALA